MLRTLVLATFVCVAVLFAVVPAARGQIGPPPPPGPTTPVPPGQVTPQPSPTTVELTADVLMTRARAAQLARGSAHVTSRFDVLYPKHDHRVQTGVADEAFTKSIAKLKVHEKVTTRDTQLSRKPVKTKVSHGETIMVGTTMAVRSGNKKWTCTNISNLTSALGDITGGLLSGAQVQMRLASPPIDSVGRQVAWHVQATVALPGLTKKGQPLREDIYISQVDYTVLRETVSGTLSFSTKSKGKTQTTTLVESGTLDFTKYGEALNFKLPKACKSKLSARLARLMLNPLLRPLVATGP